MKTPFVFSESVAKQILEKIRGDVYATQPVVSDFSKLAESAMKQAVNFDLQSIEPRHLSQFLEQVFWASTLTEERNHHLLSASLTPRKPVLERGVFEKGNFHFKSSLEFEAKVLAKLSPALEGSKHHIGVWINKENKLEIWGLTTDSKIVAKTIEVGQLLVFTSNTITQKLQQRIIVDNSRIATVIEVCKLFPTDNLKAELSKLALGMRDHHHGATLMVVEGENWKKSISEANYFESPVPTLLESKKVESCIEKPLARFREKVKQVENSIHTKNFELLIKLTAPDGATIVNGQLEVIAFAAKLKSNQPSDKVEIILTEPLEEFEPKPIELSDLKSGTRHKSAARFVSDLKGEAFAIVVSSDGKISIMYWEKEIKKVRVIQHAEYMFL
jgi:hypothetical protein